MKKSNPFSISPAIVIPCFNRPLSLKRLLGSLQNASYPDGSIIPIIFTIDYSGSADVKNVAENFEWLHGPKVIHQHEKNIGLRENILFSGDLTSEYSSIILLEDDSIASKYFYHFACTCAKKYLDDEKVAQISLYGYEYSEIMRERFHPLKTDDDVFFMKWASSRGQMWTIQQWTLFRDWLLENPQMQKSLHQIPRMVFEWKYSWKKHFIQYLVETNRYVCYPYDGYTSNFGSDGTNSLSTLNPDVNSPLTLSHPSQLHLPTYEVAKIFYDSFFQIESRSLNLFAEHISKFDYEVDLQGTKDIKFLTSEYLLSIRESSEPIYSFSWNAFPFEMNIILNIGGNDIHFAKTNTFKERTDHVKNIRISFWTKRLMYGPTLLYYTISRLLLRLPVLVCRLKNKIRL